MSRKKSTNYIQITVMHRRMKDMKITEKQIASHVKRPLNDINAWLKEDKDLPWKDVFEICELLNAL